MWPFSKTRTLKLDIDQLASAIIHVALGSSKTYESDMRLLGDELKEADRDVALMELFNLRLFVAVYASQKYLRGVEVKQRFREIFIQIVHKLLKEANDPRLRLNPDLAIDEINRRLVLYMNAVSVPHHLGPPWNVGKVFCQLCTGKEEPGLDVSIVMVGSLEFAASVRALTHFLRDCKRTDASNLIDI